MELSDPLRIDFEVACSVEHAFAVWTSRIGTWWPPDHTVTAREDVVVVLEAGVGGRIYERSADGVEHDWGEVTRWQPPEALGYLWHLGVDRALATEVQIRFVQNGVGSTRVEIEQRGWNRLGATADERRDANRAGWASLLPHYLAAIAKGDD